MKTDYIKHRTLRVGIPYTYGSGANWYVLLSGGPVIYLNDPDGVEMIERVDAEWQRREAVHQPGFKYAVSMEIL